ncbi:MAG: hypothetical protein BMS9Abin12_0412 [Acidimicrobiia bacterium]|nr:MAG: hypothetical protein BMS9Abin12_0412 [Acidimicrobiia bacterium]
MTVPTTIDEILKQIQAITSSIETIESDGLRRLELVQQRDQLRADARVLANAMRHPRSVETEIAMLEARLEGIDDMFVTKGHAEKYLTKGFSDPGAYSAAINRKIAQDHAEEIREINDRLAELRAIPRPQDDDRHNDE